MGISMVLEQEWKITSPNKDDQLPQDEAGSMVERELEITSSNEDDQLPQDEADLMTTSRDIPDDGVITLQGPPFVLCSQHGANGRTFILEQEWKITSPHKDDQLSQDEAG
ncbi:hypothetical protein IWQ61_009776, partial [Dispira simplex]